MDALLCVCKNKYLNEEHGCLFLSHANVRLGMTLKHSANRISPLTHLREAFYYLSITIYICSSLFILESGNPRKA